MVLSGPQGQSGPYWRAEAPVARAPLANAVAKPPHQTEVSIGDSKMRMSIHLEKGKNKQDGSPVSRVGGVQPDSEKKNKAILELHLGGCLRKTRRRCRGGLAAGVRCTPLCHGSCDCGNRRRPSACP